MNNREHGRIMVIRLLFFFLSAIITVISGMILVRKLSLAEYAVYQVINKRFTLITLGIINVIDIWIFRDVARLYKKSLFASIKIGFLSGILLAILTYLYVNTINGDSIVGILSAFAIFIYSLWLVALNVLEATRPVIVSIHRFVTRSIYVISIILLVYILKEGIFGALSSLLMGYFIGVILAYYWIKKRVDIRLSEVHSTNIRDLLDKNRITTGIFRGLIYILSGLDVIVVLNFIGNIVVSAFFVLKLIHGIILEAFNSSFRYLQYAGLKGESASNLISLLKLVLAIVIGPLAFMSIYSTHVVYLLNPQYEWIAPLIWLISIQVTMDLLSSGLSNILMGEIRERGSSEALSLKMYFRARFIVTLSYLCYVIVLVGLDKSNLIAIDRYTFMILWLLGLLLSSFGNFISYYAVKWFRSIMPLKTIARNILSYIAMYSVVGLLLSFVIGPRSSPSVFFWEELSILISPALIFYIFYLLLIIFFDKDVRNIILGIAKTLMNK
ncbi:MAG: hypothetical protein GSR81_04255 [Desulfurococcales archaeon]|nr:hypothetical protein [Desulfurococcales archaeon]